MITFFLAIVYNANKGRDDLDYSTQQSKPKYLVMEETERAVFKKKQSTLDDLKIVVEDGARNMSEDVIYRVADHFALRCKMYIES